VEWQISLNYDTRDAEKQTEWHSPIQDERGVTDAEVQARRSGPIRMAKVARGWAVF